MNVIIGPVGPSDNQYSGTVPREIVGTLMKEDVDLAAIFGYPRSS